MTAALAGYVFCAVCYGVAAGFPIRFDSRHSVSIAAALAPAVAWLGVGLEPVVLSLVVGPSVVIAVLLARRRSAHEIASHLLLFCAAVGIARGAAWVEINEPLLVSLASCVLYLVADGLRQRFVARAGSAVTRGDRRTYWLLHAVVLCACGLTILGLQRMDWPAFGAMAMVLALTKREFEAFGQSRDAYEQTVAAIDELKSRATVSEERA